jgi:hypothetical protein
MRESYVYGLDRHDRHVHDRRDCHDFPHKRTCTGGDNHRHDGDRYLTPDGRDLVASIVLVLIARRLLDSVAALATLRQMVAPECTRAVAILILAHPKGNSYT